MEKEKSEQNCKQNKPKPSIAKLLLRSFLRVAIVLLSIGIIAILCILYARFVEPKWLAVKTFSLSNSPTVTLIHITDIHYKGDREYLSRVVETINEIDADFVCFTGDLVEDKEYLSDCVTILSGINKPLYGIPGNHDQWANVRKEEIAKQFAATGGEYLVMGEEVKYSNTVILIAGHPVTPLQKDRGNSFAMKTIMLYHYPSIVDHLPNNAYDLILAGHTHGGQVCIPFVDNPVLQKSDAAYSRGLFHTEAGPLYVNPGIGTFFWPIRFRCRPEITVIKL